MRTMDKPSDLPPDTPFLDLEWVDGCVRVISRRAPAVRIAGYIAPDGTRVPVRSRPAHIVEGDEGRFGHDLEKGHPWSDGQADECSGCRAYLVHHGWASNNGPEVWIDGTQLWSLRQLPLPLLGKAKPLAHGTSATTRSGSELRLQRHLVEGTMHLGVTRWQLCDLPTGPLVPFGHDGTAIGGVGPGKPLCGAPSSTDDSQGPVCPHCDAVVQEIGRHRLIADTRADPVIVTAGQRLEDLPAGPVAACQVTTMADELHSAVYLPSPDLRTVVDITNGNIDARDIKRRWEAAGREAHVRWPDGTHERVIVGALGRMNVKALQVALAQRAALRGATIVDRGTTPVRTAANGASPYIHLADAVLEHEGLLMRANEPLFTWCKKEASPSPASPDNFCGQCTTRLIKRIREEGSVAIEHPGGTATITDTMPEDLVGPMLLAAVAGNDPTSG